MCTTSVNPQILQTPNRWQDDQHNLVGGGLRYNWDTLPQRPRFADASDPLSHLRDGLPAWTVCGALSHPEAAQERREKAVGPPHFGFGGIMYIGFLLTLLNRLFPVNFKYLTS